MEIMDCSRPTTLNLYKWIIRITFKESRWRKNLAFRFNEICSVPLKFIRSLKREGDYIYIKIKRKNLWAWIVFLFQKQTLTLYTFLFTWTFIHLILYCWYAILLFALSIIRLSAHYILFRSKAAPAQYLLYSTGESITIKHDPMYNCIIMCQARCILNLCIPSWNKDSIYNIIQLFICRRDEDWGGSFIPRQYCELQ